MKLHQAKEQNDKLDAENRALRDRVRILESEKKNLLDQVSIYRTYLLIYYNKMNKISYDRSLALTGVVFFFFTWQRMMLPKKIEKIKVFAVTNKMICLLYQLKKKTTFTNGKNLNSWIITL